MIAAMRRVNHRGAWLLLVWTVLGATACNLFNNNSTSPSASTTDTLSGLVSAGSPAVMTFTVTQAGTVAVTLTSVTPTPSGPLGLGVGTPSGTNGCTLTDSISSAVAGSTAQITTTENAGSYCVEVYNVGTVTTTSTVTVTVTHS